MKKDLMFWGPSYIEVLIDPSTNNTSQKPDYCPGYMGILRGQTFRACIQFCILDTGYWIVILITNVTFTQDAVFWERLKSQYLNTV